MKPIRRNVRRWAMLWRVMRDMRDRKGADFALERAIMWRTKNNPCNNAGRKVASRHASNLINS